jgi:hypothetical protein
MSDLVLKPPPYLISGGKYQGPSAFDLKDGTRAYPDENGNITIPSSANRPHDNFSPLLAQGWTLA